MTQISPTDPVIYALAELSTHHLTVDTVDQLLSNPDDNELARQYPIVFHPAPHGCFINVRDYLFLDLEADDDLHEVVLWADANGFHWLFVHEDAQIIHDLPLRSGV